MAETSQNSGIVEQWLQGIATNLGQLLADFGNGTLSIVSNPVNSTAFSADQVAVGTGATVIKAANTSRKYLAIKNIGANPVFIGGSGVTTGTGYSLGVGVTLLMQESVTTAAVYGIVAGGTETVSYLEW